jgi:hypothetical protein
MAKATNPTAPAKTSRRVTLIRLRSPYTVVLTVTEVIEITAGSVQK